MTRTRRRSPAVRDRKFADSSLEEDGIELSVPPRRERLWDNPDKHCYIGPLACRWLHQSCRRLRLAMPRRAFRRSGTDGSNPVPSSGESAANQTFVGGKATSFNRCSMTIPTRSGSRYQPKFRQKAAPPPQTRPSALGRQILAQGRACVVGVEQAARPVGRQRSAGL